MDINGVDIKEIWNEIERFGIKRKDLERKNIDNNSLHYIYLTAVSENYHNLPN